MEGWGVCRRMLGSQILNPQQAQYPSTTAALLCLVLLLICLLGALLWLGWWNMWKQWFNASGLIYPIWALTTESPHRGTQTRNCSLDSFVYHPSAIGSSGPSISKLSALKYSPLPPCPALFSTTVLAYRIGSGLVLQNINKIHQTFFFFFHLWSFQLLYYSHMLGFLPTVLWARICAKCCPFKKADDLRIHISHQHCSYFTFRMPETAEKIPGQIIWKRGRKFSPLGFHQTSRTQWFTIGNWTFWMRIWRVEGAKHNFPTSKFCWSWGEWGM